MSKAKPYRTGAIQDTGNPVLDSTINLLMNLPEGVGYSHDDIRKLHGLILQLYEREPPHKKTVSKPLAEMARSATQSN